MELIRIEKITKIYPGITVLSVMDFTLHGQEIVSLLGENGVGKATLMKALYRMTPQSSGEIFCRGEPIRLRKPVDTIERGICMTHQHFMLVPAFTVTENTITGSEPSKNKFLDMKKAGQQIKDLISQFHFNIDLDAKVEKLSVGEQQRVEILKVPYRKADVIILDELTAILASSEVDDLLVTLKRLRDEGKSIITITHKLKETKALANKVVVLRDGCLVVDDVNPADVATRQLPEMIVDREVNLQKRRPVEHVGKVCVHLEHLTVKEDGQEKVKDVSFGTRHGRILGIVGVKGNGQSQLIEALTGLREPESMKMTLNGKGATGSCRDFPQDGIRHIPEDRLSMGLVKGISIMDNMILRYRWESDLRRKSGLLEKKSILRYAQKLEDRFQVKAPNVGTVVSPLSGGNQRRIIIVRAFSRDPKTIIIVHPTWGVDIGAIEHIHSQLIEFRDQGTAVLLIFAGLDEVRALSDKLLVIHGGKTVSEGMPGGLDEVGMGLLVTGGHTMVEKEVQAWTNR